MHCDSVPAEQREAHTVALVRRMAKWAAGERMVSEVIQLPLNGLEEQVPGVPTAGAFQGSIPVGCIEIGEKAGVLWPHSCSV